LAQSGNDGSIHSGMREEVLPVQLGEAEVNALFVSCLPMLRKTTRRMLRNVQDSEDVMQDSLLLAFRKLHLFEGRSSFSTWLHSIARNCSRIHFRKENAQRGAFVELAPDQDQLLLERGCVETRPSPEELCIQRELSDILRRTTEELPTKYHDAIKCFHLDGLGERETARRLRMTPSALKAQLHRSRRILTSRIRSSYIPESPRTSARCRKASRRTWATQMGKHQSGRGLATGKAKNAML